MPGPIPVPPVARVLRRVRIDGECWIFTGALARDGYGRVDVGRRGDGDYRGVPAHRVTWEDRNGAVPAGLILDHLCRRRACVNPDHLEPVTNRENLRAATRPRRAMLA